MKKTLVFALGAVLLTISGLTPVASAASEAEKLAAIQAGLAHLASLQSGVDGSWTISGSYKDAGTGAAVFAFLAQQAKWPTPTTYTAAVTNGINFLLSDAVVETGLSTNNAGVNICPGGTGTCSGIYWGGGTGRETYSTGLVVPAIDTFGLSLGASSVADSHAPGAGHPLGGLTWAQIAQQITNAFAAGQATSSNGNYAGGWHYNIPGNTDADGSTTQWGVIAIGYDEALGAVTPAIVKTYLPTWLGHVQATSGTQPSGGYSSVGAACYDLFSSYCDHSETGGWELSMQYVGSGLNAAQLNGITFLNTAWKEAPNSTWFGFFGHPYAMWAVYKGLESTIGLADNTHIHNLNTDCGASTSDMPGSGVCNWWEDMNHYLVKNQLGSGAWADPEGNWPDPLSTSLFVNILGATPLPASISQPPTSTVPLLSEWGIAILAALLAGFGVLRMRQHKANAGGGGLA